jgi:LPXTG-motif cell wall-anchored protein
LEQRLNDETDKWTQLSTYSPTGTTTATVNVPGLVNGYRYKLVETTPPDGYEAAGDIFFKVANGAITLTDKREEHHLATAIQMKQRGGKRATTMTVTNYGNYEFPEAGGAGTVAFRIIGIAILAAAIYLLISKAKKNKDGGAPAPQTETGSEGEAPADPIAPTDADGQGTRGSEGGDGPTP